MYPRPHLALRRALLAMLMAGALAGGLAGCSQQQAAPSFSYTLLDGAKASSDSMRGKVLLVNFWATSCVSCVKEMPQLAALHRQYQARGFETLAVAMSYDPPAAVSHFAQTRALPFGVVIDNTGAIAKAFNGTRITPTTFVIDKRGLIVKRYVGEPDFGELNGLVGQLLADA